MRFEKAHTGPRIAIALLFLTSTSTLASILLGRKDSEWIAYVLVGLWVVALSLVGTLIAARRPENPIGWLFLVSATFISLSSLAQAFAQRWVASGPTAELAAWFTLWLAVPGFAIFVWVFLFFPTGRLLADRWVWATRAAWAGTILMILKLALRPGPIDSSRPSRTLWGSSRLGRASTSSGTWVKDFLSAPPCWQPLRWWSELLEPRGPSACR